VNNQQFPNQGTYYVTAVWKDSMGGSIDTKTTHLYSIPSLGWPIFGALFLIMAAVLSRRLAAPRCWTGGSR
jgi:hypothetical protein